LTDRLCTDRLSPWLASPASSFLSYRIKHFSDSPLIRCRHGARGARIHLEGFNIPMLTIQPSPNGRPDC
jgi:hypothetical protein